MPKNTNYKHIVFDMDDTLCNTSKFITDALEFAYLYEDNTDKLNKLMHYRSKEISTFLYDKELRDDTWKYAISPLEFAFKAEPSKIVGRQFEIWLNEKRSQGIGVHICTHRGFMPDNKGTLYTEHWLGSRGIDYCFDNLFVIKSSEHPNKLSYLEEALGTKDFLLVDDNPLHDPEKEHPHDPRLIIYTGINKLPGYVNNLNTINPLHEADKLFLGSK